MDSKVEALVKAAEAYANKIFPDRNDLEALRTALANLKGEQTEPGITEQEHGILAELAYGNPGMEWLPDAAREALELRDNRPATPKPAPEPLEFRTKGDPEANGRAPQKGDQRFSLKFPLEDGRELIVHEGREGMNHFAKMIGQMMVDDQEEADGK